jgi:UrcA family protein
MKQFLLATATLGMVLSAQAVERDRVSAKISYTKQQLQSEDGANQVLTNLQIKILEACRGDNDYRTKLRGHVDRECFDPMLANAISKIDAPNLTAVYHQRIEASAQRGSIAF